MKIKIYLLLFWILVVMQNVKANNGLNQILERLSSKKITLYDTSSINKIITYANKMNRFDLNSSIYFHKKALEFLDQIPQKNTHPELISQKASLLRLIAWDYSQIGNISLAEHYFNLTINFCKRLEKLQAKKYRLIAKDLEALVYTNRGIIDTDNGKYDAAIKNLNKALSLVENHSLSITKAKIYGALAAVHIHLGNYNQSLSYNFKALKINQALKNSLDESANYSNIGIVYDYQGDFTKAINYYSKAYTIAKRNQDLETQANNLSNLGVCYMYLGQNSKALYYYQLADESYAKINDINGRATCLSNKATVYSIEDEFLKALECYKSALKLIEKIDDKKTKSIFLNNIGVTYYNLDQFQQAIPYLYQSIQLSKQINALEVEKESYSYLSDLYIRLNRHDSALLYYQKHIQLKDSIYSIENNKSIIEKEIQFNYDKKATADSVAFAKEKELKNAELQAKRNQQYGLGIVLVLIMIFAYLMYKRYKVTQTQKNIIEMQKNEVEIAHQHLEEKNREILDSITYAKRIQSAILPQPKLVKEFLEDSFILYKPKDIVAGDFYWLEVVGDTVLFAAADCTGHGVPGAMVSVVCNNGLNRAVREFGLTKPNEILDKTRELVIQEFEKSDEDVKDGMDISLCALDTTTNLLSWSGAHNPLWVFRKNLREEIEVIEIKADKQPIGKFSDAKPFTIHQYQLKKEDVIYIFTDGYQDQFGGPKEKKFRAAQMKELFLSLKNKTMEEQRKVIDTTFEDWKGNLEQVDDVCVIGVRI